MKLDLARVFGGVEAGVKVDIKRSDGRIHEACVTGINADQQTVSVEWFEHNETKGRFDNTSSFQSLVCIISFRKGN